MRILVAIILISLFAGCGSRSAVGTVTADDLLIKLEMLELDPKQHTSYQAYHTNTANQISRHLKTIEGSEELREAFWLCHSKHRSAPPTPQDRLQWIDPYAEALNLILYELAERQDPSDAAVLVDLYLDPAAGWDAGASLLAGDAVVKCGKTALPYLRQKKGGQRDVAGLIQLIEAGASSGL